MKYLRVLTRHIAREFRWRRPAGYPVDRFAIGYAIENHRGVAVIEKLLEVSNGKLLIPMLCALAGAVLVKGIFNLHRSKSADRRDFLDLWMRNEGHDDIWLEISVRHLFGTYLPASVIRSLMQGPQAARALLEVSAFWNLLEMNDETLELKWKRKSYATSNGRRRWCYSLNTLYFVAMGSALVFVYIAIAGDAETKLTLSWWIYGLFLAGIAMRCVHFADQLKTATTGAPRWLGLP